jgi:cell division transport system permease protein
MKLVGASNNYVRGPFVISGVLYGAVSAVIATLLLWPFASWVTKSTDNFFGALDILHYFATNLFQIFVMLLIVGVVLGVISSLLAISRHLKV